MQSCLIRFVMLDLHLEHIAPREQHLEVAEPDQSSSRIAIIGVALVNECCDRAPRLLPSAGGSVATPVPRPYLDLYERGLCNSSTASGAVTERGLCMREAKHRPPQTRCDCILPKLLFS
ncbi:hypothetical protein NDU88_011405 [Pleurodeles waltl]|uniref:Uncharacterized protein n=1 Tax=Pleurodeles waltl TaxID=8319 RepID=A0AAV7PXN1_PLEWA|nr:hypothetical protein NDU88_011405 [Pleurodeles waltl]